MRIKPTAQLILAFLFLVIGFQNCSPNGSEFAFKDSASSNSVDSGNPYEGKVYATLGNLCADGSEIHSRIVMASATQAKLNRDGCQDITPVQLTSSDFQIDTATDTVTYKTSTYAYIGSSSSGITNFAYSNDATKFYYSYTYQGQPSWRQVFLDTDNNPATGYAVNGIGADYMIENDNVWSYSAPAGAPQTTFQWTSLVSANKNDVAPNISWSFARNIIGSPTIMKVVGRTSLGFQTAVVTQIPQ